MGSHLSAVQLSVAENNRHVFDKVRVKMRGKSSRGGVVIPHQDKPCGLKCHVYSQPNLGKTYSVF